MNAQKLLATFLALVFVGAGVAQAGPAVGTPKARGDFGAYGATRSYARSGSANRYYAPAPVVVNAPAAAPETQVAQAPAEGQRFSIAPSADAAATTDPCPQTAAAPEAGRRYSYAPEAAETAPRTYVSRARTRVESAPLWSLPKTDPRKFNSH